MLKSLVTKPLSSNRSGRWVQNLSGNMAYNSFCPAPLPPVPALSLDEYTLNLVIEAHRSIAYLEGLSARIPSLPLFVSMYVRKEALLSSQIEGTQATLEDILDPDVYTNANRDVIDVVNYVKATEFAIERLKKLPLCNRLIREIHAVLMEGVRGQEKSPGEFRTSQNWIGGVGSTLRNARYVPPNPDDMKQAISDLEQYLNNVDDTTDILIKTALMHYQFETIHPFLDGNGRVGRLMITLFFMENSVLSVPSIYISYFLKRNRTEYYDRMSEVRRRGDYEQWVRFFLEAVQESARDAAEAIDELAALHDKNIERIAGIKRNSTLLQLFNYLEKNPIIEIRKTASDLGMAYNTVSNAVNRLCSEGLLVEGGKQGRTKLFYYEEYLSILRKDT